MNIRTVVALASVLLGLTLRADTDTVAFYPFTDIAADSPSAVVNDPAKLVQVTNAVDASAFPGKIRLLNGNNTTMWGSAAFTNDVPGRYIYSDWTLTKLQAMDIQALHFMTNPVATKPGPYDRPQRAGAALVVEAIGGELAKKGDFTIEYFWKLDRFQQSQTYPSLFALRSRSDINFNFYKGIYVQNFTNGGAIATGDYDRHAGLYNEGSGQKASDGLWHHHAVVYDATTHKFTSYIEYAKDVITSREMTENHGPADNGSLVMGARLEAVTDGKSWSDASDDYWPAGEISIAAVRVTARKLDVAEFMVALSKPYCEDGVQFHWGMHGTDGETIGTLENRETPLDAVVETARQYSFKYATFPETKTSHDKQTLEITLNGLAGLGEMTTIDSSGEQPKYLTDRDGKTRQISSGERIVEREDSSSVYLPSCAPNANGLSFGYGLQWKTPWTMLGSRAFTVEGFYRQDYDQWNETHCKVLKERGVESVDSRTTLCGIYAFWRDWYGTKRVNTGVFNLRIQHRDADKFDQTPLVLWYTYGCPKNQDGDVKPVETSVSLGNVPLKDLYSKWNHWAVSYDPETLNMKVYWNGDLLKSFTLAGPLDMDSENSWWQFGSGFNSSSLLGTVDEIRLTYRVLEPSEFLKMRKTPQGLAIIFR